MPLSSDKEMQSSMDIFKETLTILGASVAILVALLWYLGRNYARGYFASLNVPLYQVNFTTWEFGEVAWPFFLIGLAYSLAVFTFGFLRFENNRTIVEAIFEWPHIHRGIVILISSVISLLVLLSDLIPAFKSAILPISFLFLVSAISSYLKDRAAKTQINDALLRGNVTTHTLRFVDICAVTGVLVFVLAFLSSIAYDSGLATGRKSATELSVSVRLTLNEPLIVDVKPAHLQPGGTSPLFTYEQLYLLVHNDGRYFLFRTIDAYCKPEQVYVIQESQVASIEYLGIQPIRKNCLPTTLTPTPSPTVTPTPSGAGS